MLSTLHFTVIDNRKSLDSIMNDINRNEFINLVLKDNEEFEE